MKRLVRSAWIPGVLALTYLTTGQGCSGSGGDGDDPANGGVKLPMPQPAAAGGSSAGGSGGALDPSKYTKWGDPRTCALAADVKSYVGCDFWPTVTPNVVWSIFDFAAVVANAGEEPATVNVSYQGKVIRTVTVPPGQLEKVYLDWVPELKGPDWSFVPLTDTAIGSLFDNKCNYNSSPTKQSGKVDRAAYHLTSTVPVTVYQFSAIEYGPKGGPAGKDWSKCQTGRVDSVCPSVECYAYTNDASLLLPTTALTGNYRVSGPPTGYNDAYHTNTFFTVTATQDNTSVVMQAAATSAFLPGQGVAATPAGGVLKLTLNAGDVALVAGEIPTEADNSVMLVTTPPWYAWANSKKDMTGSLVQADKPVQVISGSSCLRIPSNDSACDHLEETVLPAETLGKHYLVTFPTTPPYLGYVGANEPTYAMTVEYYPLRLVGNKDNTLITFKSDKKLALRTAPDQPVTQITLNAGQVVDLVNFDNDLNNYNVPDRLVGLFWGSIEIEGNQEFSVTTFLLSNGFANSNSDPSQTHFPAVEQFRTKYVFLAPDDYDSSYVDITQPLDATVTLDGNVLTTKPVAFHAGATFGVARVKLDKGQKGAHLLTSTKAVGLQVMGYGAYTSYMYPGGMNLEKLANPPPPINIH